MRFVLIDPRDRKAFNLHVPEQVTSDTITRWLRCDVAVPIDLTDDLEMWVPDDPRGPAFQLMGSGPRYFGRAIVIGRTRLGDIKSLPRHYLIEAMETWFTFPQAIVGQPLPRRQMRTRPEGCHLPASLSIPTTESRPEPHERLSR